MSPPRTLRTHNGRPLVLARELGKGGEGTVYEVQGSDTIVAKIYHHNRAAERHQKIEAIVAAQWHKTASCVAFPIDSLFGNAGQFVGFTMSRIAGNKPIHDLYSPTSRKTAFPTASFPFLIRTGLNIARALARVHATGCVVGDLNHSGILIADNALATLIDCDSFQVQVAGKTFLCKVGVPDFTPPEMQGRRLDQIVRTPNHDAFGLAVVLFNLLFMGRHPFAGRFLGRGDMPLETAIAQYRFAYSARKNETWTEPPPNVPVLSDVPPEVASAFEVAFGQVGVSNRRPDAAEWAGMLTRAEREVVQCTNNQAHHYFRAAASCPWCRMENAYPGFLAFAPRLISVSATPVNLGQLIAAIKGVSDPGIAPDLASTMPAFTGTGSPLIAKATKAYLCRYAAAIFGAMASVVLFRLQAQGPMLGLVALAISGALALRESRGVQIVQKTISQTTAAWRNVEIKWNEVKGNHAFAQLRKDANNFISQLQNLGGEENKQMAALKARQREAQLTQFLQQYYVANATIRGIGRNRKIMLRSYGIETAADIQGVRIRQISGFGPVAAGALVAWRTAIEGKFVFRPNQPIPPAEIAAVKSAIFKTRSQLEGRLRQGLTELEKLSNTTRAVRNSLREAAVQIWKAKAQAEIDKRGLQSGFSVQARLGGLGVVMVITVIILNGVESLSHRPLASRDSPSQSDITNSIGGNSNVPGRPSVSTQSQKPVLEPPDAQKKPARGGAVERRASQSTPSDGRAESGSPKRTPQEDLSPAKSEATAPIARGAQSVESDPTVQRTALIQQSATQGSKEDLVGATSLSREQVLAIQSRLRHLGYLSSTTSGSWDAGSRDALRDFKTANRLGNDDILDLRAQERLNSRTPIRADQSFIGNWCQSPDKSDPPLAINSLRARSAGGDVCEFDAIQSDNMGWRIRASCTVDRKTWTTNFRLTLKSNKLVWTSGNDVYTYVRCD